MAKKAEKKVAKKSADKKEKPAEKKAPPKAAKAAKAVEKPAKAKPENDKANVEQELLKLAGIGPQEKGEDFGDYAKRLAEAVDGKPEKEYDKLSEAAQSWYNAAVEAMNEKKPVPAFSDAAPETATKKKGEEGGKKKAATETKKASAKAKAPREPSASSQVLAIVCSDLTADADVIVKQAKKDGIKVSESQMRNVHRLAHLVIRGLKDAGKLK